MANQNYRIVLYTVYNLNYISILSKLCMTAFTLTSRHSTVSLCTWMNNSFTGCLTSWCSVSTQHYTVLYELTLCVGRLVQCWEQPMSRLHSKIFSSFREFLQVPDFIWSKFPLNANWSPKGNYCEGKSDKIFLCNVLFHGLYCSIMHGMISNLVWYYLRGKGGKETQTYILVVCLLRSAVEFLPLKMTVFRVVSFLKELWNQT